MKIEIKSRISGKVLFAHEAEGNTVRITLEAAVEAGVDLARANLARANLAGAYLAGANLAGAHLEGAYLAGAYLEGVDLARANLAGAYLAGAYLAGAYLAGAYLAGVDLEGANLARAHLEGAYLAGAHLEGAYLAGAHLEGAYLEGVDLAGVPVVPNIDATILAAIEAGGKLCMGEWHTCETTHCRAGWAITLAGKAGAELEAKVGPSAAGALIYAASRPGKPVPDFYASDEAAMDDIRAGAQA